MIHDKKIPDFISTVSNRLSVPAPIVLLLMIFCATPGFANEVYNGSWQLDEKRSDDLQDVMERVRRENQEEIDQREEERQKRQQRPDIFGRDRSWDDNRARGATAIIPKLMRTLISSQIIKIYFSRKLAIAYDKSAKRLLTPNPNGRVYSASGAGISKDEIGETLSYIEDGVLYIETRTAVGRLKERIDPLQEPGTLVIDWTIDAPAVPRAIEMTTVYDKL